MKIRTGDTIKVISGKDAGKTGKVERVDRRAHRAVVPGVAVVKKHTRPSPKNKEGGIIAVSRSIDISSVALVCPKCKQTTRIGHSFVSGKKVRVCKKCGKAI